MVQVTALLTAWALSTFLDGTSASPLSLPISKRADLFPGQTCTAGSITQQTWEDFGMDVFLATWSAVNVTVQPSDNVQSLAASFGAPNFFCGLDGFCNAGQPCEPVAIPGWYALVAIQNWNSYMNSINTAITFASNIAGLTLPGIVKDFFPKPVDNVTPLKNVIKIFSTVLGVVPFTGEVKTAASVVTGGLNFVSSVINPPAEPDLFVDWSDVSTSLATALSAYQAAVSKSFQNVLNTPVNQSGGINDIIAPGDFFGVSQNVSQSDLQSAVTSSIEVFSIGLVLQAQKIFISRNKGTGTCQNDTDLGASSICINNSDGSFLQLDMLQSDKFGNANPQIDTANLLVSKYSLSQQQFLFGPAACKDANNGAQLTDPFDTGLPLDATTQCLFNLIVCDGTSDAANDGIVGDCRKQGLNV